MKKAWLVFGMASVVLVALLCIATAETVRWTNPTTGIDNAGATVPLTTAEKAALKDYLYYRIGTGAWTSFAATTGGQISWAGTLPAAVGVAAEYALTAGLVGADGIERKSGMSPSVSYTVPFPPGPTPGSPTGPTITRP